MSTTQPEDRDKKSPHKPFVVKPRAMGLPPGMSYDNIGELLEWLDRLEGN